MKARISKSGRLYKFVYGDQGPEKLNTCQFLKDLRKEIRLSAGIYDAHDVGQALEGIFIALIAWIFVAPYAFLVGYRLPIFRKDPDQLVPIQNWPKIKGRNIELAWLGVPLIPSMMERLFTPNGAIFWNMSLFDKMSYYFQALFFLTSVWLLIYYAVKRIRMLGRSMCLQIEVID